MHACLSFGTTGWGIVKTGNDLDMVFLLLEQARYYFAGFISSVNTSCIFD